RNRGQPALAAELPSIKSEVAAIPIPLEHRQMNDQAATNFLGRLLWQEEWTPRQPTLRKGGRATGDSAARNRSLVSEASGAEEPSAASTLPTRVGRHKGRWC
ncbi:MAG: hypothetical protein ACREXG_11630, partial [Polaromonas sp.]